MDTQQETWAKFRIAHETQTQDKQHWSWISERCKQLNRKKSKMPLHVTSGRSIQGLDWIHTNTQSPAIFNRSVFNCCSFKSKPESFLPKNRQQAQKNGLFWRSKYRILAVLVSLIWTFLILDCWRWTMLAAGSRTNLWSIKTKQHQWGGSRKFQREQHVFQQAEDWNLPKFPVWKPTFLVNVLYGWKTTGEETPHLNCEGSCHPWFWLQFGLEGRQA